MTLTIYTERNDIPAGTDELLEQVALACVKAEGVNIPVYAALQIIGDEEIHAVNKETRGVDRSTDVLSFPTVTYPEGKTARDCEGRIRREYDAEERACFIGDILLSLPHAIAQAQEYGHSLRREMCYLTAHAMFHLMGYDHMVDEDKAKMRALEESALKLLAPRDTGDEPTVTDTELFEKACEMLAFSYAPYSNFRVGAALLCDDGRVFTGCNIENSSYGATICAERSAVSAAIPQGSHKFTRIAIAGASAEAWPCGICRQVLSEFATPDMEVIVGQQGQPYKKALLTELLPHYLIPEALNVHPDK